MATAVIMPKLGMAMNEGEIVKWLHPDSEPVDAGTPVVRIMSKKITYEVTAPRAGILRQTAREGTKLPVGAIMAYIADEGEAIAPLNNQLPHAGPLPPKAPSSLGEVEVLATPAAKRLAREHGIDLRQVTGTGPRGRIQEQDVFAALNHTVATEVTDQPNEVLPFVGMRRAIAERMVESLTQMAQVTLVTETDAGELSVMSPSASDHEGIGLTGLLSFLVVRALRRHPRLNAALTDDGIVVRPQVHLGIAVALDDGLLVPVVHHADQMDLATLDREVKRLVSLARSGQLSPDDATDGTFTITNLGMFGIDAFTPIINPPEVAILGVGRMIEKPVVYRGSVAVRPTITLSLTFDHRVVDGAPAAAFLKTLAELVSHPHLAMLFP